MWRPKLWERVEAPDGLGTVTDAETAAWVRVRLDGWGDGGWYRPTELRPIPYVRPRP